ncbi:MAG: hypothetical protein ACW98X_25960 [Promethearchaeota archaeon]|jgi:hypothetical protein
MWYHHVAHSQSHARTFEDGGLWGFEFFWKHPDMPLQRDVSMEDFHNPKWFESEKEIESYLNKFSYVKTTKTKWYHKEE